MRPDRHNQKLNILVSNPNMSHAPTYLPGIFGILRSAVSKDNAHQIGWLPPVFRPQPLNTISQFWDFKRIDVLALSNYVWNREFNFLLAKFAKSQNPNIVVIAGGPDPDHSNPKFFEQWPAIDAVVVQDAEIPFGLLIHELLAGGLPSSDIPGVLRPGSTSILRGQLPKGRDFDRSYWLESKDVYESIVKEVKNSPANSLILPFETDRGCPFQCSFCDWGSNTFSKMRLFPTERVAAEIDWIGATNIDRVVLTNSNFGMFERDIHIAELFAQSKRKYGYPLGVAYSLPKTDLRYAMEILKVFASEKMVLYNSLPFQSTSKAVLGAMNRKSLSANDVNQYIAESKLTKTSVHAQLILGQPGDCYETFLQSLSDIANLRIFDGCAIYPFMVLPNAPAAAKNYREQWQMKTIWRPLALDFVSADQLPITLCEYCVESSTYSRLDYIKMWGLGCIYQAVLDIGILRFPILYLNGQGVRYNEILSDLQEHFFSNPKWHVANRIYASLLQHLDMFVNSENKESRREMAVTSNNESVESHEFLAFQLLLCLNEFLEEAKEYFYEKYRQHLQPNLFDDLWKFQKASLALPHINPIVGQSVALDFDWGSYFEGTNLKAPPKRFERTSRVRIRHNEESSSEFRNFTFFNRLDSDRNDLYFLDCVSTKFTKSRVLLASVRPEDGPELET